MKNINIREQNHKTGKDTLLIQLVAEDGKILINSKTNEKVETITIPSQEVDDWIEEDLSVEELANKELDLEDYSRDPRTMKELIAMLKEVLL